MAGAVTGGGLTVIANSPNPAGQSILGSRFGKGFFCLETSGDDARVDPVGNRIDDRNNEKHSRPLKGVEFTQTQYNDLVPLISNLNCGRSP